MRVEARGYDNGEPRRTLFTTTVPARACHRNYGKAAPAAMNAVVQQGLTKTQILQNYGYVVGGSDVSLQVRRGEIFCIMGLSGIGKSTLIRLLNKLITPSAGKIVVKGKDL